MGRYDPNLRPTINNSKLALRGYISDEMGHPTLQGSKVPLTLAPDEDGDSMPAVSMRIPHAIIFEDHQEKEMDLSKDETCVFEAASVAVKKYSLVEDRDCSTRTGRYIRY
jgi:diaminopimelate epimerase